MSQHDAAHLLDLDRRTLWHPFTQAREWMSYDPLLIESAEGYFLTDVHGRRYLDGV